MTEAAIESDVPISCSVEYVSPFRTIIDSLLRSFLSLYTARLFITFSFFSLSFKFSLYVLIASEIDSSISSNTFSLSTADKISTSNLFLA